MCAYAEIFGNCPECGPWMTSQELTDYLIETGKQILFTETVAEKKARIARIENA